MLQKLELAGFKFFLAVELTCLEKGRFCADSAQKNYNPLKNYENGADSAQRNSSLKKAIFAGKIASNRDTEIKSLTFAIKCFIELLYGPE